MLPAQEPLLELVGALYDGAASPHGFDEFLKLAALRFKAESVGIAHHDGANDYRSAIPYSLNISPDGVREYGAYFGARNPTHAVLRAFLAKQGYWHGLSSELVRTEDYVKTEYYNDWGRKYGSYSRVLGVVGYPTGNMFSLSIIRSNRKPLFGADGAELMAFLFPHLRRVAQIRALFDSLQAVSASAMSAIDALERGVIAVDGRGEVVVLNQRAEEILRKADGLRLEGKKLSAANPYTAQELDALVRAAAATGAGRGMNSGGAMLIPRQGGAPLQISVTPFHSSCLFADKYPCAVIFVTDPSARLNSRAAILAAAYRLSPTECRLAEYMVQGIELHDAAERMRITPATARFMIKNIFRKTGTHRQANLTRFLLRLPISSPN